MLAEGVKDGVQVSARRVWRREGEGAAVEDRVEVEVERSREGERKQNREQAEEESAGGHGGGCCRAAGRGCEDARKRKMPNARDLRIL